MAQRKTYLTIRLVRSPIGCPKRQKETLRAMGLTRVGKTVRLPANKSVMGMVKAVQHLVESGITEGTELEGEKSAVR